MIDRATTAKTPLDTVDGALRELLSTEHHRDLRYRISDAMGILSEDDWMNSRHRRALDELFDDGVEFDEPILDEIARRRLQARTVRP